MGEEKKGQLGLNWSHFVSWIIISSVAFTIHLYFLDVCLNWYLNYYIFNHLLNTKLWTSFFIMGKVKYSPWLWEFTVHWKMLACKFYRIKRQCPLLMGVQADTHILGTTFFSSIVNGHLFYHPIISNLSICPKVILTHVHSCNAQECSQQHNI